MDATTETKSAHCTLTTPCSAECARNSWYGCRKVRPTPAALYAERARASKAAKLVDSLDYAFDLARVTPQEARYEAVAGLDDAGWKSAASCACVNLPSLETREIVLATLRRRVQASVDAQIAAFLRKAVG